MKHAWPGLQTHNSANTKVYFIAFRKPSYLARRVVCNKPAQDRKSEEPPTKD